MSGPLIPSSAIVPSDNGSGQLLGLPDRPDKTPEQREAERRKNLMPYEDVQRLFKTEDDFRWMLDHHLLGDIIEGTKMWSGIRLFGTTIMLPKAAAYFRRDAVLTGLDEVRRVAAAIR